MTTTSGVGGIVLCGGLSSRMGRPKAWLPFAGEIMLPRVVRLLRLAVAPVVVVAATAQDVPPLPDDVTIVRDPEPDRGPMQGLAAGLAALRGRVEVTYASSCDVPFLNPAFVVRMIELLGDDVIAVPNVGGYRHPLAAVYRLSVLPVIEKLLVEDRLRTTLLFDRVLTRLVREEELIDADPGLHTLRNLNSPEDYEAALQELK